MNEVQRIFTTRYVEYLKSGVKNRSILGNYQSSQFVFEESETLMYPGLYRPDGLVEELDVSNDCDTAIKLYEAYMKLTPLQASDIRFWTYLTHVDLFSYVQNRWSRILLDDFRNEDQKVEYILSHWFIESVNQSHLLRHSLAGLWWSVRLAIDENRNDKYELVKVLFRQLDFPTRTLGLYKLGRHKEAVIGILEFILENEDLFSSDFQTKTRFITKYINRIGGTNNLAFHSRTFFKSQLSEAVSLFEEFV